MPTDKEIKLANLVFDTLCKNLERNQVSYDKQDELSVSFTFTGDDIPVRFIFEVDAERQIVCLYSPFPFKMNEENIAVAAIATSAINYILQDGCFLLNINTGGLTYRMVTSFSESLVGSELFSYMIGRSFSIIEKYNDKFLFIKKGVLSIEDFIKGLK